MVRRSQWQSHSRPTVEVSQKCIDMYQTRVTISISLAGGVPLGIPTGNPSFKVRHTDFPRRNTLLMIDAVA